MRKTSPQVKSFQCIQILDKSGAARLTCNSNLQSSRKLVEAGNNRCCCPPCPPPTCTQPPAVQTLTEFTVQSDNTINLAFAPVAGADSYVINVYRTVTDDQRIFIGSVPTTSTSVVISKDEHGAPLDPGDYYVTILSVSTTCGADPVTGLSQEFGPATIACPGPSPSVGPIDVHSTFPPGNAFFTTTLSWAPLPGADRYFVEIFFFQTKALISFASVSVPTYTTQLVAGQPGGYYAFVFSISDACGSSPSFSYAFIDSFQ